MGFRVMETLEFIGFLQLLTTVFIDGVAGIDLTVLLCTHFIIICRKEDGRMSISLYNIKKWTRMLLGNSVLHVNQGVGKYFVKGEIKGYYNDLTEKVTRRPELLEEGRLPIFQLESGETIHFATDVFQTGLGAYDMFLETGEDKYIKMFGRCVDWAVENQDSMGRWDSLSKIIPDEPFSAMIQGEGTSLLLRAYKHFGNQQYFDAAKKSVDFMLLPIAEGGTSLYDGEDLFLAEYPKQPIVLNGWIFAMWGLYDLVLTDKDSRYAKLYNRTYKTMEKHLPRFSTSYWSKYCLGNRITSPFYHRLHIAQLTVLYELTGSEVFNEYVLKWKKWEKNPVYKIRAFCKKSFQKIME